MKTFRYLLIAAVLIASGNGLAQAADSNDTGIAAQPLDRALEKFAEHSGMQVIYVAELANGKESNGADANLSNTDTLDQLLASTGLDYEYLNDRTVTVQATKVDGGPDLGKTQPASSPVLMAQNQTPAQSEQRQTTNSSNIDKQTLPSTLEEIVVTAQKREQRLIDVPISIVAMDAAELESRGIEDLADLAIAVPELTVIETFPGSSMVFIRGLGSFTDGSSLTGIYLDEYGVSISGFAEISQRVVDLERAEVLRGPQGTLYGQGAVGGTVRLITKTPELDRFSARADSSFYLTQDSDEVSHRVSGVVNIPVVEDVFGVRIAGEWEAAGGWVDNPVAGEEDVNDREMKNVRINGLWRPSDALEVKGTVLIDRLSADSANANIDENRDLVTFIFPGTLLPGVSETNLYGLTVTYDFGPVQLLSASSYFDWNRVISQSIRTGLDALFTDVAFDVESFTQELRLSSTGEGPLVWTAGVFYRDVVQVTSFPAGAAVIDFGIGPIPLPAFNAELESKSWAVFGDASYALTDRLEFGGGVRYFEDDREINDGVDANFDKLTWRTYLSFDLTQSIKTYASIATGFRSGGINFADLSPFNPDELLSYEVGAKGVFFDGQVTAELALFYSDYKDLQALLVRPPTSSVTNNVGDAEIKGVDWSLVWYPVEDLTLAFSGNVIDSEISKLIGTSTKIVGDPVDFVPGHSYTVSLNYAFDWSATTAGSFRLDFNEQGKMNYIDRVGGQFGKSDRLQFLNARLGAAWENWSLELFAKNLLDEDGEISAFGQQPQALNSPYRSTPRTIGVKLGVAFN